MRGTKQPPPSSPVSVVIGGKTYTGSYYTERGMIIVTYGFRRTTTQLGGTPEGSLARLLLHELVRANPDKTF